MKLLITGINAKFVHSSLAIRYLKVVTKDLPLEVNILELSINNHLPDIANRIFDEKPDIISLSCYIWNIELIKKLLPLIKLLLPNSIIILGGPEVSYETKELMESYPTIDYVIRGEGEEVFPKLIKEIIENTNNFDFPGLAYRDNNSIITSKAVTVNDLNNIPFPYEDKDIKDLRNRIIYYESSRGCPYSCKYCLSCATKGVRYRSLDKVFKELDSFIKEDVRQVKFVDRTFNADKNHFLPILEYIATQDCRTNFHFEIVAYNIDSDVEAVLAKMPPGRVQFEIGIQSTNKKTLGQVSRANHWQAMVNNIQKILKLGTIHLHVDLIIGLPYEDLESFKTSFNDVYKLQAQMVQVGFLKLLKGAGMNELTKEHNYIYTPQAPYEIISNKYMNYSTIRQLQIFVDMVEHYYNSGLFSFSMKTLTQIFSSPYDLYCSLANFWFKNNLHLVAHSPQKLTDVLIDFIDYNHQILNKDLVKNAIKFDSLIADKGKFKNNRLPWFTLTKTERDQFFKSDLAKQYIPDFNFKSWRELINKYHIEIFNYNFLCKELQASKTVILFDFNDKTSYQAIQLGGYTIK